MPGPTIESIGGTHDARHMATVNWPLVKTRSERFLLGLGMSAIAWLLERAVVRTADEGQKTR